LVIDADAINALAALPEFHRDLRAPVVFTPHPGEFRRLAERLGVKGDPTDAAQRSDAAAALAQKLGCVVVLKGQHTIISDGHETHVNQTGNAALATAGTGDVLTGVIAGLIAQFFKPSLGSGSRQVTAQQRGGLSLLECARFGVHIHGLAADQWAARNGHAGMLATDLLTQIPLALRSLRESGGTGVPPVA
jgi:ADP-dependent NAD(P)H-hydrate dehydratase